MIASAEPPVIASARRAPAWTITALMGLVYVFISPPSSDLAAASYRSALFAGEGFTLWDNSWYGGHHLPAYSVLAPALGALIGPQLVAAISLTVASALFAALIEAHFPPRATRIAALWFALGAGIALLSSRVPFDLGVAIGLGALLAAQRGRWWGALALAVLCSLASPVAGAFLAIASLAWTLAGPARAWPAALTAAAIVPIALLALAFPEGGTQPFVASAFYPAFVGILLIGLVIPPEQRVLRIGVVLYALMMIGAYVIPSAVGGNADRLGVLVGASIAACVLAGGSHQGGRRLDRRAWLLILFAPALLYWQANAPVADFASAASDPAVHASYYEPLIAELDALGVGYGRRPARIEVVPTADHWEARWLAPHVMIARGWERQLDTLRDGVFYDESNALTAARYRAWLGAQAISYVALPDAPADYSAVKEAQLLGRSDAAHGQAGGGGVPYLREIWQSRHWRLFAVLGATPLAEPPAVLTAVGHDWFTLLAPRAGAFTVRVRFTPYWVPSPAGPRPGSPRPSSGHGCVSSAPGGWTLVSVPMAESIHVVIRFSVARIFNRGPRCA